jgi:hypothetical protein
MSRVVVTERNTFEIARRAADNLGLAERDIMRRLSLKYEIGRLFGRE